MGVLREGRASWCFCAGAGRSERVKAAIFSTKGAALAAISSGAVMGTGFLIHRSLLLTTHATLPSVAAAEGAEIRVQLGRVPARLVPHRFFITSSVLDLTIVGLDTVDTDSSSQGQQPQYLKTCSNPSLDLGSTVYLLGHTDKKELTVGEGKVVIATDNLIKLSTDGVKWLPGSAGFDLQGNIAFMVCDPMKLASSPMAKSSSASSSSSQSWKKEYSTQFGIPIPIICDWLHQHWEGNLDDLGKPKLPIMRLMSSGQRSEHSCASFTLRQVFKPTEEEDSDEVSSAQIVSGSKQHLVPGSSVNATTSQEENRPADVREQGIPTPQIYESPRLTSGPVCKKGHATIQLLDINFPPRAPKTVALPLPLKQLLHQPDKRIVESKCRNSSGEDSCAAWVISQAHHGLESEVLPVGSCQEDCSSEVQSSSSPVELSELRGDDADGFSSGEQTMYSAETMESRNFPSPRENKFQQVGRSQSCVNYSRWTSTPRNSTSQRGSLQKQHSLTPVRKSISPATVLPQRNHDYLSPTVSSSMKKRNNAEQQTGNRKNVIQVSSKRI